MQSFASFWNIPVSRGLKLWLLQPGMADTKELVERCKRGEEQALSLLYTTYRHKLEQVARKYVKDEADVQDIVHDSFIIIFTSINRLCDHKKLESWMCTIVRNLSLKHLGQPATASVERAEAQDVVDEGGLVPDYDRLMELVEQLPSGYRKVLKLSVLEGLSHKEIGELLGIAPHSSSSQLARAKTMIRKSAKRYGILLLALLAALLPFMLKESGKEPVKVAKTPVKVVKKKSGKDSIKQEQGETLTPLLPQNLVARRIDSLLVNDSSKTLVAVVEHPTDSVTEQPSDTTAKERQQVVPMPNRRGWLMADDDYPLKKEQMEHLWNLAVSFAGGNGNSLMASVNMPGSLGGSPTDKDDGPKPDTIVDTRTRHLMPLTFGLSLSKQLTPRWSVESGLRYTLLRSETTTTTTLSDYSAPTVADTTRLRRHYIGVPLRLTYRLWQTPSFSLYTIGGGGVDVPINSSDAPLWSVSLGLGLQYRIVPNVSLYAELGANWFLNSRSNAPALRTNRSFEFTIPVGLRFSW